jgi:hypothetical protein
MSFSPTESLLPIGIYPFALLARGILAPKRISRFLIIFINPARIYPFTLHPTASEMKL